MIKESLSESVIEVQAIANSRANFIRMNGVVIGTVGSLDGSGIHLHQKYDEATVGYIRDKVQQQMTNKIGGTAMLPPIPKELLKAKRAIDDNYDIDT